MLPANNLLGVFSYFKLARFLVFLILLTSIKGFSEPPSGLNPEVQAIYDKMVSSLFESSIKPYLDKAKQGDSDAQVHMGSLFLGLGDHLETNKSLGDPTGNYEEALLWFYKAAEQGHGKAFMQLSKMYRDGLGVDEDSEAAFKFAQLSSLNYEGGQHLLGMYYLNGYTVPKSLDDAIYWFEKASKKEHLKSLYILGVIYALQDGGIEGKKIRGFNLLERAAIKGIPPAQDALARCFVAGAGTNSDFVSAYAWAAVAAGNGYKKSQQLLESLHDVLTTDQISIAKSKSEKIKSELKKSS
jgi:TPR repeat protein